MYNLNIYLTLSALLLGTGYVEDGREIFDDDVIEDTYVASNGKESGRGTKRKARLAPQANSKGNIRNLIGAMPVKKKEVTTINSNYDIQIR